MHIRIATRRSPLALWQANFVATELSSCDSSITTELVKITSKGDKILDVPLAKVGGKGLFTKEIDHALELGNADVAVHSLKDVPTELPVGMSIVATPERGDPRDAIVTSTGGGLARLSQGSKVGTSSLRRICQIKRLYPHLQCVSIRGSVQTRLSKLGSEVDAVILAAAGLKRLGLFEQMDEAIDETIILPAVGQGTLAIQTRDSDARLNSILSRLNHTETADRTAAERAFLATLEGGCQVPIAGYATVSGDTLLLRGRIGSVDGQRFFEDEICGSRSDARKLGSQLAQTLLDAGAREVLEEIYQ